MNTLVKDGETESFLSCAVGAWNAGADALILSDAFLGKFIKQNYPEINLHLSTQAGVCNIYGARFAKECGFSRVVLARETTLEDIKAISDIIETEAFVQGALCTCFSGQCYFSSFAGGNSGNRGKCKQPCRKKYSIDEQGFEEQSYKLSLSDLCVGQNLDELLRAGVYSLKIEGRMRRSEYVAAAVAYYKRALQGEYTDLQFSDLKRAYNRGNYTHGLAFGQDKTFISSAVQGHIGEFVGNIRVQNGNYLCMSGEKFREGDGFKILRGGKEVGGASYLKSAKDGFLLSSNARLKNGDKVFVTTDTRVNEELLDRKRVIFVKIKAKFVANEKPEIYIDGNRFEGEALASSVSRPLTREEFENNFNKTDKYPFKAVFGGFETDGVFMPVSKLNSLRRSVYSQYFSLISQNNNEKYSLNHVIPNVQTDKNEKTSVICTNLCGVAADIGILKPDDYSKDLQKLTEGFTGEKYLYLPPYLTGAETNMLKGVIEGFDGIYCEGIYGFKLSEELNKPLFAGIGLNISNKIDIALCNAKYVSLSKELTATEIKPVITQNAFYLTCGDIKVMDLIYCPYGKKCGSCRDRDLRTLTDENVRKFPLRRYRTGECRFEVYNCVPLVAGATAAGTLADCTLQDAVRVMKICKDEEKLRAYFKNYTKGHYVTPVN